MTSVFSDEFEFTTYNKQVLQGVTKNKWEVMIR